LKEPLSYNIPQDGNYRDPCIGIPYSRVIYSMHNKIEVITLLLLGLVIGLTGLVCADSGVNATPEVQSLSTVTSADVTGLVTETDSGVWTLTNNPFTGYIVTFPEGVNAALLDADYQQLLAAGGSYNENGLKIPSSLLNVPLAGSPTTTWSDVIQNSEGKGATAEFHNGGIHTGTLDENQVQYTAAYDANIVAQGGKTSFVRQMTIDTRNKVTSQSNVRTQTDLTFAATDNGGNVVGSENLMLDGAGDLTYAAERMLCPFASSNTSIIPAFCNIVQAGSNYDLTIGSVTTSADGRFVGTDATDPVVLNYAINVKPYGTSQGQVLASGSAMAYIKAHAQEARGWDENLPIGGMNKSLDFTYAESSSAQGTITAFSKDMHYSSQVTSVAIRPARPPAPG
jgi:hypothetical protein